MQLPQPAHRPCPIPAPFVLQFPPSHPYPILALSYPTPAAIRRLPDYDPQRSAPYRAFPLRRLSRQNQFGEPGSGSEQNPDAYPPGFAGGRGNRG